MPGEYLVISRGIRPNVPIIKNVLLFWCQPKILAFLPPSLLLTRVSRTNMRVSLPNEGTLSKIEEKVLPLLILQVECVLNRAGES